MLPRPSAIVSIASSPRRGVVASPRHLVAGSLHRLVTSSHLTGKAACPYTDKESHFLIADTHMRRSSILNLINAPLALITPRANRVSGRQMS